MSLLGLVLRLKTLFFTTEARSHGENLEPFETVLRASSPAWLFA